MIFNPTYYYVSPSWNSDSKALYIIVTTKRIGQLDINTWYFKRFTILCKNNFKSSFKCIPKKMSRCCFFLIEDVFVHCGVRVFNKRLTFQWEQMVLRYMLTNSATLIWSWLCSWSDPKEKTSFSQNLWSQFPIYKSYCLKIILVSGILYIASTPKEPVIKDTTDTMESTSHLDIH